MFGSIRIGSVFGITVRMHWLFLALVFVLIATGGEPINTAIWLAVLFGVVFLHELGHSLVARAFGIHVLDITFWPLGGMARMSEIPESTKVEALVAIAGPMVNFVLAGLAFVAVVALGLVHAFDPRSIEGLGNGTWGERAALSFLAVNLMLGVFNLIPAFPMDGGRILRALFGLSGNWVRATELAVTVGRVFAVLLVLAGVFFYEYVGFTMPLIGVFVWWAGSRELWAVRARHGLVPFGPFAGKPMPPGMGGFTAPQPPPPPRPGDGGLRKDAAGDPQTGARKPLLEWRAPELGRGRVTDDAVARLERFRGRMIQRPDANEP